MAERASKARVRPAEVVREYGPFPGAARVHGVTFDGTTVWFAAGNSLRAFDPGTGKMTRSLPAVATAGTAFDGTHLFQLGGGVIQKIDPATGHVVSTLPVPEGGPHSGLTWAEGALWIARYRDKAIVQIDARTGRVLRTVECTRFVTGVTWADGGLWHGTRAENENELLRIDPASGEVLDRIAMPEGMLVSGVEADGDVLFCEGDTSGTVRAVRRTTG